MSGYGNNNGQNYGEGNQGYGQNQSYDQNQGYNQNQSYDQNQGYGQNQSYDQNQGYGQNQSYDQNQGYGQNQSYDQNQGYGQNQSYDQNQNQGDENEDGERGFKEFFTKPNKNQFGAAPGQEKTSIDKSNVLLAAAAVAGVAYVGNKIYKSGREDDHKPPHHNQGNNPYN
ncbi:hypothetical protein AYI70_g4719 [Smittium culicis]|uniref:Uncharacterized protein n=1 Tax=Smittium culicis TaxID=133412 RepID=A0A1R1XXQ4_9FUNG|nr:hypothetical protein AYI70_g4719 [Smittium culicis]